MTRLQSFTTRRYDSIEDLAPFWDELITLTPDPRIFQTFGWHRAWLRSFSSEGRAVFLLVLEDNRPLLLFPGFVTAQRLFGFLQSELGLVGSYNYSSDYLSLIGDHNNRGALKTLVEEILKISDWDTLKINNLDPEHLFSKVLTDRARDKGMPFAHYSLHHSPVLDLSDRNKLSAIFSSRNSKRRLKQLLEKSKGVFQEYYGANAKEHVLITLFEMHTALWKQSQQVPQFQQSNQVKFFEALTEEFEFGNQLKLCGIELDSKPIALHLGLEYNKRHHWYKPAYSIEFAKLSPGEVLLLSEIKDCELRNISLFDFGAGSEQYKFRFASATPELEAIELYRAGISRIHNSLRSVKRYIGRHRLRKPGSL